ncbi:DUF6268 family outer membrane beta-barrel protein [Arundinibacter roseus]|uniref:DUF6268 domain-containing protein n=1 Tax=Arundinibacter roseus TaxID=2070510 RepID=A0A4R4K760_9BACT|nr:DUF6268 family outer membrane beta-barrel protein [Arundinibacter roseus]TDB63338.1 hypothetical protein EZE20_16325 [Arundinibacter roseus]
MALPYGLFAQTDDDDFDPDAFEMADETPIKRFCTNKITNLSPTRLVGISFDYLAGYTMSSQAAEGLGATEAARYSPYDASVNRNSGLRLDSNIPLISKNNIIVNLTASYWESRYDIEESTVSPGHQIALNHARHPLRTSTLGTLIFKPLDEKHFLIFQAEAALNGNYNFGTIKPDFGLMKYSATAIYGWKYDDNRNFGLGVTRTYRGGRVLHIPVLLWNRTFNDRWGMELLLPARGHARYNFSTKSMLMFGYELEGQSYHVQSAPNSNTTYGFSQMELRKSEIRARVSWDKSLTDFIWFNIQAGVRPMYRYDLAPKENADAFISNRMGMPLYFRIGLNLVSP